jgi:D-alanine-D-alanine ligase
VIKKKRVAIIYGGQSFEHEVSMLSARGVMQNLDPELFEAIPVKISQEGTWIWGDESVCALSAPYQDLPRLAQAWQTDRSQSPQLIASQSTRKDLIQAVSKDIDVVFPLIHGVKGEDGCLQGMLEMANIPYVGCSVMASALGMDKHLAKNLVSSAGIPVVPYKLIRRHEWKNNADEILKNYQNLKDTFFVKPANTGSSVGINKVTQFSQLQSAIDEAFLYDNKVIIENGINAREIELAVLENEIYGELPRVSIPGEIVPKHDFYSYKAKYVDPNGALLLIPAELQPEQVKELQNYSQQIFQILECEGMARIDFFIDRVSGTCYFNEINTIPGFTPISMFPKLWEFSGVSYQNLITTLLNLALAKHERNTVLHHKVVKNQELADAIVNGIQRDQ